MQRGLPGSDTMRGLYGCLFGVLLVASATYAETAVRLQLQAAANPLMGQTPAIGIPGPHALLATLNIVLVVGVAFLGLGLLDILRGPLGLMLLDRITAGHTEDGSNASDTKSTVRDNPTPNSDS